MQQQMLTFEDNEKKDAKPDAYDRIEKRGYRGDLFDSHEKFLQLSIMSVSNIYEKTIRWYGT